MSVSFASYDPFKVCKCRTKRGWKLKNRILSKGHFFLLSRTKSLSLSSLMEALKNERLGGRGKQWELSNFLHMTSSYTGHLIFYPKKLMLIGCSSCVRLSFYPSHFQNTVRKLSRLRGFRCVWDFSFFWAVLHRGALRNVGTCAEPAKVRSSGIQRAAERADNDQNEMKESVCSSF